ncbi:hypothetical protein ACFRFH_04590 [Leifsonia sp. NPDC056824]|uniref:hypothetical protein n=1 Tax=Leifsonia sp. NPDC056824 TaxID=3345953 RepID=UPI003682F4DE
MPDFYVRVANRRLDPVTDLETTRAQIVDAVREGGDFVDFVDGARVISVLITPSTTVTVHPLAEAARTLRPVPVGPNGLDAVFPSFDAYEDYGV